MKEFLDGLVAEGKEAGEVKTMYGRIRPIPELSSSNFMQRQFGERIADELSDPRNCGGYHQDRHGACA